MDLKNKTINFLGDSITEGIGLGDARYDNVIKRKVGLKTANNYGLSGTRIAYQVNCSTNATQADLFFCGRAYLMDKSADVVIVYGGVNDFIHGDAPFGTLADNTPTTFCGAVDFLMRFLKELYSNGKILFLTPARCKNDENLNVSNNKPLKAYVDVIVNKGKEYDVPVLNLYDELGINPNIEEDMVKYAPDGLHFNAYGHGVLADKIIEVLNNL